MFQKENPEKTVEEMVYEFDSSGHNFGSSSFS
jgi:hypothetical protein